LDVFLRRDQMLHNLLHWLAGYYIGLQAEMDLRAPVAGAISAARLRSVREPRGAQGRRETRWLIIFCRFVILQQWLAEIIALADGRVV
jgi:hypothetical protein